MNTQDTYIEAAPVDYHLPVMLHEAVDGLSVKPHGVYVDCTFGGGGHSREILRRLGPEGKLYAFDQDRDAQRNLPADDRLVFVAQNFRHLQRFLRLHGATEVDGVLADLGVSSHQFDEGTRGFSTRFEGPLDMRMDQGQERTAAYILQAYGEAALHKLFERWGEVTNAKTLARTLAEARKRAPIDTTAALKAAIAPVVKGKPQRYWAQVFQALRMEVNEEMAALEEMLHALPGVLKPCGRASIITFHSIEDRLVKTFFRDGMESDEPDNPFISNPKNAPLRPVNKKPIEASEEEQKRNPRSRSARLRIAEKK